jgi:hypothetical protein
MCSQPLPRPPPPLPNPHVPPNPLIPQQFQHPHVPPQNHNHPYLGRLPKLPFPSFDGENPRRWRKRCEKYFSMYGTEHDMWISVAEMHFEGATSCWYQSIESELDSVTWEQFCAMVSERFDRDQHEILLRKRHHIKQTSSVFDYVTSFTALIDQLTVISKSAVFGAPAPRTIQFIGSIQGAPIIILLDSSNTSSFISTSVVQ